MNKGFLSGKRAKGALQRDCTKTASPYQQQGVKLRVEATEVQMMEKSSCGMRSSLGLD